MNHADLVYPNLYVGEWSASGDAQFLKDNGITYVLNVCAQSSKIHHLNNPPVTYTHVPIYDEQDEVIRLHFDVCHAFIDLGRKDGSSVLMHCPQGVSRSPTVVNAYIMSRDVKLRSRDQACDHVKAQRSVVWPNPGFMMDLQYFEKQLNSPAGENQDNTRDLRLISKRANWRSNGLFAISTSAH